MSTNDYLIEIEGLKQKVEILEVENKRYVEIINSMKDVLKASMNMKSLAENQEEMPQDFAKIIDDNFDKLLNKD